MLVIGFSVLLDAAIWHYGKLRRELRNHRWLRQALAIAVLPRISEWHVILSPMLLPSTRLTVRVDVLMKSGILYDGALREKILGANGELQSITLEKPRRFKREEYLEKKKENPKVTPEPFWKEIPGESFVILAGDISTLNIRHVPATVAPFSDDEAIKDALSRIRKQVDKLAAQTAAKAARVP